jgi:hypothetical protein
MPGTANTIKPFRNSGEPFKEPSAVPYAHSLLGTEYLKTKNNSAAIVELREAGRLMPGMAANRANLRCADCMTGKAQMGEQELHEAIKLDKTSPQAQYLLGLPLLDQKSPEASRYLASLPSRVLLRVDGFGPHDDLARGPTNRRLLDAA